MKVLLIDNDDSFTHILAHYLGQVCGEMPHVVNHKNARAAVQKMNPTHIVLSPGPGHPNEYETIVKEIPTLGICLGHQALAAYFGAKVVHAPKVMHGKTSKIKHCGTGLFERVKNPLTVMRYHSLAVENLPDELEILAKSEDGVVMAFAHRERPIAGLQFHPESIGTEDGLKILGNFLQAKV